MYSETNVRLSIQNFQQCTLRARCLLRNKIRFRQIRKLRHILVYVPEYLSTLLETELGTLVEQKTAEIRHVQKKRRSCKIERF